MQPELNNLITQNEYFDYQRAVRNITNYNCHGLRSLTVESGQLIYNPNYGFIQVIKDLFLGIFVKDYHLDDANNKKSLIERDFKIIRNTFARFSQLSKKCSDGRDELYELYYTASIAREFAGSERLYRHVLSEPKGHKAFIRKCLDNLMGYSLPETLDRQINWPDENSIGYFSRLPWQPVSELVQFNLNTCENVEMFHVNFFLSQLVKEHADARVLVRYCFAVSEYMKREDKQSVFDALKQKDLRELFVGYCLKAIEANWNTETGMELLRKTASIVNCVPDPSQVRVDFGSTLVKLKGKNPQLTFSLYDFLDQGQLKRVIS